MHDTTPVLTRLSRSVLMIWWHMANSRSPCNIRVGCLAYWTAFTVKYYMLSISPLKTKACSFNTVARRLYFPPSSELFANSAGSFWSITGFSGMGIKTIIRDIGALYLWSLTCMSIVPIIVSGSPMNVNRAFHVDWKIRLFWYKQYWRFYIHFHSKWRFF